MANIVLQGLQEYKLFDYMLITIYQDFNTLIFPMRNDLEVVAPPPPLATPPLFSRSAPLKTQPVSTTI